MYFLSVRELLESESSGWIVQESKEGNRDQCLVPLLTGRMYTLSSRASWVPPVMELWLERVDIASHGSTQHHPSFVRDRKLLGLGTFPPNNLWCDELSVDVTDALSGQTAAVIHVAIHLHTDRNCVDTAMRSAINRFARRLNMTPTSYASAVEGFRPHSALGGTQWQEEEVRTQEEVKHTQSRQCTDEDSSMQLRMSGESLRASSEYSVDSLPQRTEKTVSKSESSHRMNNRLDDSRESLTMDSVGIVNSKERVSNCNLVDEFHEMDPSHGNSSINDNYNNENDVDIDVMELDSLDVSSLVEIFPDKGGVLEQRSSADGDMKSNLGSFSGYETDVSQSQTNNLQNPESIAAVRQSFDKEMIVEFSLENSMKEQFGNELCFGDSLGAYLLYSLPKYNNIMEGGRTSPCIALGNSCLWWDYNCAMLNSRSRHVVSSSWFRRESAESNVEDPVNKETQIVFFLVLSDADGAFPWTEEQVRTDDILYGKAYLSISQLRQMLTSKSAGVDVVSLPIDLCSNGSPNRANNASSMNPFLKLSIEHRRVPAFQLLNRNPSAPSPTVVSTTIAVGKVVNEPSTFSNKLTDEVRHEDTAGMSKLALHEHSTSVTSKAISPKAPDISEPSSPSISLTIEDIANLCPLRPDMEGSAVVISASCVRVSDQVIL